MLHVLDAMQFQWEVYTVMQTVPLQYLISLFCRQTCMIQNRTRSDEDMKVTVKIFNRESYFYCVIEVMDGQLHYYVTLLTVTSQNIMQGVILIFRVVSFQVSFCVLCPHTSMIIVKEYLKRYLLSYFMGFSLSFC